MCTVSYIPTDTGYIQSANRDEFATRPNAKFPAKKASVRGEIVFPQDPEAGGTWFAFADGLSASLLNGAYKNEPKDFAKSRGLILLEAFDFATVPDFLASADFSEIDAFTMVLIDSQEDEIQITEVIWDGENRLVSMPNPNEQHLWVSIPEAYHEILDWRKELFNKSNLASADDIKAFHLIEGDLEAKAVKIAPNDKVYTRSFTQFILNDTGGHIQHENF